MLFRTVYGPELKTIFMWIQYYGPASKNELFNAFMAIVKGNNSSSTNMEDALSFLEATGLISNSKGLWKTEQQKITPEFFKMIILQRLRMIQIGIRKKLNPLDPFYLEFLDILYIQPDILFRTELHSHVNNLDLPAPCSIEKVNAWRRVLEYLGTGVRGYGGLFVQYNAELVMSIINEWSEKSGPLQSFLEEHFEMYLPWKTRRGDIARSLSHSLELLEKKGRIKLMIKQDLPNKSYLGSRRIKWLEKGVL